MPKYYVIFMPLKYRGIYNTWPACKELVDKCKGIGCSFSSYKSIEEATDAWRCGSLQKYKEKKEKEKPWIGKISLHCIVVDAACSGCPGPVEYRGVVLPEGFEAFRHGPYPSGTNNIGEFLAIVTGLRWLDENSFLLGGKYKLYSDSKCAIGWVKDYGKCNTHQENISPVLKDLIESAESWIEKRGHLVRDVIMKWETSQWGEIPADFGRK